MNLRDNVLAALSGDKVDITPALSVTPLGIVDAMKETGAYWPEAHTDPAKMATLGSSLYELAKFECARIPFCLTVEAEALGCKVDIKDVDSTPIVLESKFESAKDIEIPEDVLSKGRIPVVLESIEILKEKYGNELPIIVGVTGPFTLSGYLLSVENLLIYMLTKPDEIEEVLDKSTEFLMDYIDAIIDLKADIICVTEPLSATELIEPLQFKNIVKPYLEDLASSIKTKSVLHICGNIEPIAKDMATIGYDGISMENKVDVKRVREEIQKGSGSIIKVGGRTLGNVKTSVIVGNIDSTELHMETAEYIKKHVKTVLDSGVDLLAPSCGSGLAPKTPLKNIKAIIEARNLYL